jgi:hypothetical protein
MRLIRACVWGCALTLAAATGVSAQQRPLATEDPEPIGAGRILIEAGMTGAQNQQYPASGLKGNLMQLPTFGISFGISAMAEVQIDGGLWNRLSIEERADAPLSDQLTVTGDSTSDVEDLVVATKIRLLSERPSRPAVAMRLATRLPNAGNESGLGLDTMDFSADLLIAKTVQSIRIVGNVGLGILADPTVATQQNDVLNYGLSFARALTDAAEIVGEFGGRWSTRSGEPSPGTESRGRMLIGMRYTTGSFRVDGGVFAGLTSVDPTVGFTVGFTYVFNAFEVP